MQAIRARLIAVVVSFLMALLVSAGVGQAPELGPTVQAWVSHTFDLLILIGYAVIHPWIQRHLNPTGAFTSAAAAELETVVGAHNLDRGKAVTS